MTQIVVIPEGLSFVNGVAVPSFVYRAVLDYVVQNHRGDEVLLAPANTFGFDISEQEAAAYYLRAFGISCTAFEVNGTKYLDSLDNIVELRRYCANNQIILGNDAIVICGAMHVFRIRILCLLLGLKTKAIVGVSYDVKREAIVTRLWYYKYQALHLFYEAAASMYHIPQFIIRGLAGRL